MDERAIVTREPLNAETRLELQDGPITPSRRHYVRSHFSFPTPPVRISIAGAVRNGRSMSLAELRALPARTATVTLECAGNGRSFLQPPAPGEQWGLGAVSTAEWTGVPLRSLLEPCGLSSAVVEILFRGADTGTPPDVGARIPFERSLPIARALADDVLVAYAMNGTDIPLEHGAPARLVVPSWYGMASVKWLAEIVALERPFRGFYQADRYVVGGQPVREVKPRAVITSPFDGEIVPMSPIPVRGFAWSGGSPVVAVELSTDEGRSWSETELEPALSPHAWRGWQIKIQPRRRGPLSLTARAICADGTRQPVEAFRSDLGYCNNGTQPVRIEVA